MHIKCDDLDSKAINWSIYYKKDVILTKDLDSAFCLND